MSRQKHEVEFGNEGKACVIIDDPALKFWKRTEVFYDLSKCKREYKQRAFKEFSKIVGKKLGKRELHFHIHFGF